MEISTHHIGGGPVSPASVIEVTINSHGETITEDVVNLNGYVDEEFIQSLKGLVEELEDQNRLIAERDNPKKS